MITRTRKVLFSISVMLGSAMLVCAALALAAAIWPIRNPRTAGGVPRVSSAYIRLPDGTNLATRIVLPAGLESGEKVPAILETTRYGTLVKPGPALRALTALGLARLGVGGVPVPHPTKVDYARYSAHLRGTGSYMDALLEAGYAFVGVDVRGTGASGGTRDMEWSVEEQGDVRTVIDWIVAQPWSDGRVGTLGVSYSGNTAEAAAASGHPALKGAALLYSDYDPVGHNAFPGGVFNERLVRLWSESNLREDAGGTKSLFFSGPAPVDGPDGGRLLRAAISGHRTTDLYGAIRKVEFTDDKFHGEYDGDALAPFTLRDRIEASGIPLYVRVGWVDAGTVAGALERFLVYRNPQILVVGPWGHAGWTEGGPFIAGAGDRKALDKAQADEVTAFFREVFAGTRLPGQVGKTIHYYTYGSGEWKESETWPMPGAEERRLYLAEGAGLSPRKPAEAGTDEYPVDYGADTGPGSRWRTNLGGGPVFYPDRAEQDAKLLVYTGEPLAEDTEIDGVPEAVLFAASSAGDAAYFAYLEAVAPDGKVVYLTEGILKASHRAVSAPLPGRAAIGTFHSHHRADALPAEAGRTYELRVPFLPISVVVPAGYRLRVAIAGHDASCFARIPASGEPIISVDHGGDRASFIVLPVRGP